MVIGDIEREEYKNLHCLESPQVTLSSMSDRDLWIVEGYNITVLNVFNIPKIYIRQAHSFEKKYFFSIVLSLTILRTLVNIDDNSIRLLKYSLFPISPCFYLGLEYCFPVLNFWTFNFFTSENNTIIILS